MVRLSMRNMLLDNRGLRSLGRRLAPWARGWTGVVAGRSPRAQRYLLLLAATAFVVMAVVAVRALPPLDLASNWPLLVIVGLAGVPLSLVANAIEYVVSGRIVGSVIGPREAMRVTIFATAANLLPIPGSVVVRTTALHGLGSTPRRAMGATAIVGLAWLGVTGLLAGGLFIAGIRGVVGLVVFLAGLLATGAALGLLRASVERDRLSRLGIAVVLTELATVALGAARLYLVLAALGFPARASQAAALVVAGVVAAATGVFPGGLGMRELLAAVISPLVGLPAALGLLATAVNRLVEFVVLLPVTITLAVHRRGVAVPDRGEPTAVRPEG